jgi:hypothetical protein
MKRSTWFLPVLALVLGGTASAQVVSPEADAVAPPRQHVFGLGLFGGCASGAGLSFRHHLPSSLSYQITGGIIKVDERLSYSIGAELEYDIKRTDVTRLFAAAGTSYFHAGPPDQNEMAAPGRLGIGIGGEVHAGGGFHATVELLFTYFSDGTVLPLPQLGVYYYFR